jgi:hypothetical protein
MDGTDGDKWMLVSFIDGAKKMCKERYRYIGLDAGDCTGVVVQRPERGGFDG